MIEKEDVVGLVGEALKSSFACIESNKKSLLAEVGDQERSITKFCSIQKYYPPSQVRNNLWHYLTQK
jgi:hypothetical protein